MAVINTCFPRGIQTTLTFAQSALRDYKIIVIALLGNGESSSPSNTVGFLKLPRSIHYRGCVLA